MAVVQDNKKTSLILKLETGTDSTTGAATYSNRSISSANPELTDQDAYKVASDCAGLVTYPCSAIRRQDTSDLIEES